MNDIIIPEQINEANEDVPSPSMSKNIVLVGISGSGKSVVGRHLAILLGFGFLDLDVFIERSCGKSVAKIFADEGEPSFRARERSSLEKLSHIKSHVIALGGGTLQDETAVENVRKLGPIVWLKPSADEVARRLYMQSSELEKRPLFKEFAKIENKDERRAAIRDRISEMTDARSASYQAADIVLDGGYVTPETSACQLKDILVSMNLMTSVQGRFGVWQQSYG